MYPLCDIIFAKTLFKFHILLNCNNFYMKLRKKFIDYIDII